jgi:hypothetical protein
MQRKKCRRKISQKTFFPGYGVEEKSCLIVLKSSFASQGSRFFTFPLLFVVLVSPIATSRFKCLTHHQIVEVPLRTSNASTIIEEQII